MSKIYKIVFSAGVFLLCGILYYFLASVPPKEPEKQDEPVDDDGNLEEHNQYFSGTFIRYVSMIGDSRESYRWTIEEQKIFFNCGEDYSDKLVLELPENARIGDVVLYKDMLLFTDYARKAVFCVTEKGILWESQGEDGFVIPNNFFPIVYNETRGELWVANTGKKELLQLDPKTGKFIASWQPNEAFPGCCNPVKFNVLDDGSFVCWLKGYQPFLKKHYSPSGEEIELTDDDEEMMP